MLRVHFYLLKICSSNRNGEEKESSQSLMGVTSPRRPLHEAMDKVDGKLVRMPKLGSIKSLQRQRYGHTKHFQSSTPIINQLHTHHNIHKSSRIIQKERSRGDLMGHESSSNGTSVKGLKSSTELIARAKSLRKRPKGERIKGKHSKGERIQELSPFRLRNTARSPLELQQRRVVERGVEEKLETHDSNITPEISSNLMEDVASLHYHRDKLRSIAYGVPEVHFLGEICKGSEFNGCALSCKWSIDWSKNTWSLLEGAKDGQSQYTMNSDDNLCVWNHPVDLHFTAANMKGWPRILLQVWNLDVHGRSNLVGYGFTHLPSSPGMVRILFSRL